MMMQLPFWKRALCAAIVCAAGSTLTGCSDSDNDETATAPQIEVTGSLDFECAQTESRELTVTLDGAFDWTLETDAWIETDRTSGTGSATVRVTVEANPTPRTGMITVTATNGGLTSKATCTVRQTEKGGEPTLAEALAAPEGSLFTVPGTTVAGANEQGVLLVQDNSYMYAFAGETHALMIGDAVTVEGTTERRNGLIQFGKGCKLTKTGTAEVTFPQPAPFAAAQIEAYMEDPVVQYATYTGIVTLSGDYVNVDIEGTSVQGSLDYMSDAFKQRYADHEVRITGWLFGAYKSYLYTLPVEVEDLGSYEEPVPEGAIYYSTFDAKTATMTDGKWPYLENFDGWVNHKGSGVAQVDYDYEHMSVRANQSSKGNLSLYDGSGKNNLFFSTAPNHFTIRGIDLAGQRNLRLSFGAQRYAQGATNTFLKSDFSVTLSADGIEWSQPLAYDFAVEDEPGQWRLAAADFTLPEGTGTLQIRFEAKLGSVNRIDDVLLTAGKGGQEIEFGAEPIIPISTIAEVLAGEMDKVYKAQGTVIATHTKGFLVQDATATILVFKKKHGAAVGDCVTLEGTITEYGGMKQFGETTVIEKTGTEDVTRPEPVAFRAAEFDAYAAQPVIEYVTYEGVLTETRDDHYQYHYNVAVEGTQVVGSIAYPDASLGYKNLLDRKIKVTGYAIGVSGSSVKYLNTMATELTALD